MAKICPACGKKESKETPFAGQFCLDCRMKRAAIFTPRAEISICRDCGKMKLKEWVDRNFETIETMILNRIKGDFEDVEKMNKLSEENNVLKVKVVFQRNPEASKICNIPVEFKKDLCVECLKGRSHYYNATIQIRGEE